MSKFYALLPAAGSGSRMMSPVAKQYMPLAGKPLMLYALETLCAAPDICSVFVVLSPLDGDLNPVVHAPHFINSPNLRKIV